MENTHLVHAYQLRRERPADGACYLIKKRLGLGDAQPILNALIAQTPTVIAAVQAQLPADFPQTVAEPVFTGLQTSASQLQRELI